jgi:hypothetical protein
MDNETFPVSSSEDRHSFSKEIYIKKLEKDPDNENAKQMLEWYDKIITDEADQVTNQVWQNDNLEYDLRSTQWILEKVRSDKVYAQHLYAALCNRDFTKNEVWPLLSEQKWSCSWRHAGGIIADMCEEGDYIDWYCSGIRGDNTVDDAQFRDMTKQQQEFYLMTNAFVGEGVVTDEIEADLLKLGWVVLDDGL